MGTNNVEEQLRETMQNLRDDLKEHRKETREDIKSLEKQTNTWHEEVRAEFGVIKDRLTTIETQITTKADIKKNSFERIAALVAIIVSTITAWVMYTHK